MLLQPRSIKKAECNYTGKQMLSMAFGLPADIGDQAG